MKTSVILCFLFAFFQARALMVAARAVDTVEELDEDEVACVNELNLDRNKITRLNRQDVAPENDADFNNFLGCSWQKSGLQNSKNGKIDYEALKVALQEVLTQELAGESPAVKNVVKQMIYGAIDECRAESPRGRTHGQTAVKVQNCIMKKLNQLIED